MEASRDEEQHIPQTENLLSSFGKSWTGGEAEQPAIATHVGTSETVLYVHTRFSFCYFF